MPQPRIIARILGGIGNQLFIYSAARRLALASNSELVLDHVSGFAYDHTYQRHYQLDKFNIPCRIATAAERLEPLPRLRRYLRRRINQARPFDSRSYIQQEGIDFDPRLLQFQPKGAVHLEGYWQSEGYFKDVESTIRKDLRMKPPEDQANLAMAHQINQSMAVAIHVRFFDDPQCREGHNLTGDYFNRAISSMERLVPGAHYFVFSDRPSSALTPLQLPISRLTMVDLNSEDSQAIFDLWLMSLCKHFIISNSTFSWWGAWLSTHPGKHCIAPAIEIRKEKMAWGFRGLIPDGWVTL